MSENPVELSDERLKVLESVLDQQQTINQTLREQLTWNSMLMGEDRGWDAMFGARRELFLGPSLIELKEWSLKLRESLGNVHMQRGLRLRTNNIWSGGIHYNDDALPSGSGVKVQTKKRIDDSLNRRNFFGGQAHAERESALYTDGLYLVLGDPSDWTLEPVALEHIGALAFNPTRADEIIAYRIDFVDYSNNVMGEPRREWHYTDLAYARRGKPGFNFRVNGDEVGPDARVIFDQHVNTQVGWALGVPDALTAYAWAKVYRDFVMNGKVMSDAMAQFAFQIATGSRKETDSAAARIAQPSDAGATLIGANSLVPLPTAGKGYDFESGRPLLAIIAAALEVSVISLSSDPGASGHNSAMTLDLPTRLAMESRRSLHIEFDRRVLLWMGANPDLLEVTFATLDDAADLYREIQALILALSSGLYDPEAIEDRLSTLLEVTGNTVPSGYMLPNNINTLKAQAKLAPAPVAPSADPAQAPNQDKGQNSSTAAPDQGKNNPAGNSAVKGNDIRNKPAKP